MSRQVRLDATPPRLRLADVGQVRLPHSAWLEGGQVGIRCVGVLLSVKKGHDIIS